jgi:peptidyl-prolyl cis-trans isomerase D
MLSGMRKAFETGVMRWILIVMLGILMVSFAIWGIGDIFRGSTRERVASVGSTEITGERFRTEYDRERQNLSRRAQQPISSEQARAAGLHDQVLQRLVDQALLDERARQLMLGVSDTELARLVIEDPNFRGGGPDFNRAYFNMLLQQNNMTEAAFIAQRRFETRRLQMVYALMGGIATPQTYERLYHRFNSERRAAEYVVLPAERFAEVTAPSDETLEAYFRLVSAAFRAPETRTAEVLVLTPEVMAARAEVSDEDARTFYDQNQTRFGGTPERRRIQQLTFPSEEAARAAAQRIAEGTSFEQAGGEGGPTLADLGLVTRANVLDPAVRDAAFALAADTVSPVVQGRFGWLLLRVSAIEASSIRPFEELRDRIKRELALDRARRQVFDMHDRVEERRLQALRLPEIAEQLGLQIVTVTNIDRQGRGPDGTEVQLPGGRPAIDAIFAATQGADNEAVQIRSVGGYVWVDLREIAGERDRPLAEVREQVVQRWTEEQRRSRLAERGGEILTRLQGGTALAEVAQELGLEVQTTPDFTRTDVVPGWSRTAIDEAFRVTDGGFGAATADNNVDRVVFHITKVEIPAFEPGTVVSGTSEIVQNLQGDLLVAYVRALERDLGVSINRTVLDRIAGGGT